MQPQELDYKQYLNLLKRHKQLFVLVVLTVATVGIIISYVLPKRYEAKSVVFIEKSIVAELVKGIAVSPSLDDKVKVLNYAITSRTLLAKVIDELDMNISKMSEGKYEQLISETRQNLTVKLPKEKESLFTIIFQHDDPRIARDFVNTLVRRYIEENSTSKREDSSGATRFLTEQATMYRERLEKAENEVNAFKRGQGALAANDPNVLQKEINESQQRIDDLRIKRSQLETQLSAIKRNSPMQAKLTALQKQLADLTVQYTDNYPEVRRVKSEIEALQQQMRGDVKPGLAEQLDQEKIVVEIRTLKQAEENLKAIVAANRSLMHGIPAARAKLEDLEREKNSQKQIYEQLAARQGQSEVSQQLDVQDKSANYRIVDPAVMPVKPVSPNRLRIMLMGVLAGIGAGAGVLFLLDKADTTVKTAASLKQFNVPLLVIIPKLVDDAAVALQRKKDLRLYTVAAVYSLFLLFFVVTEALQLSLVDQVLDQIQVVDTLRTIKNKIQ